MYCQILNSNIKKKYERKIIYKLFVVSMVLFFGCRVSERNDKDGQKRKPLNGPHTNGWLRGCNFIPSTAVNQLEMWQAETFDKATINRELGFGEALGFNVMRVFLHHKAWIQDPARF